MGNMLDTQNGDGPELSMPSRDVDERNQAQRMAEEFYPKVFPDLAAMSKEEMAMLLHGLVCKLTIMESDWKHRKSYVRPEISDDNPCRSILRLYYALDDYAYLATFEDIRIQLDSVNARNAELGGSVYVAEFSDGHIKIGHSIFPERRLRDIAGGNQSKMLRHWISDRVKSAVKLEHRAHRHFAQYRSGGEFFRVDFDEAVTWLKSQQRGEGETC